MEMCCGAKLASRVVAYLKVPLIYYGPDGLKDMIAKLLKLKEK